MTQKNPSVAGLLNVCCWGSGYAYSEIRNPFGVPWLVFTVAFVVWYIILFVLNYSLLTILYTQGFVQTNPLFLFQAECLYYLYGLCAQTNLVWNPQALGTVLVIQAVIGAALGYDVARKTVVDQGGSAQSQTTARLCPQCSTPLSPLAEFCPQCGRPLSRADTSASAPDRRCLNCGTYNPVQYRFCKRCGKELT